MRIQNITPMGWVVEPISRIELLKLNTGVIYPSLYPDMLEKTLGQETTLNPRN